MLPVVEGRDVCKGPLSNGLLGGVPVRGVAATGAFVWVGVVWPLLGVVPARGGVAMGAFTGTGVVWPLLGGVSGSSPSLSSSI